MGLFVNIVIEICCFHMKNENMNSLKFNEKKINFINRLKYAEQKIFCICIEVYQLYEGNDYDKICEILSTLKNKKLQKIPS